MAHIVNDWSTWKPEIDAYIQDEKDLTPKYIYKELFNETSTDRLQINEMTWSGFGPIPSVGEMGEAVEDEALEGYQTSYSAANYRKKAVFSSTLMRTDQSGNVERIARDFVRTVPYTRNLNVFSNLRKAWDQTRLLGDGKSLVSTAHPRKDGGGTQSNTFSGGTQKPLTYDNALELQDVMIANVSNTGNLLSVGDMNRNKCIVTSTYNREEAFQIAGVDGPDYEPDTTENNKNYFRHGDKFDVLVTQWIGFEATRAAGETSVAKTSASNYWDTMWFLVDTELAMRYFKVYVADGYEKYDEEIIKTNEALVKYVFDSFAHGITSYLPLVGSKGDNSTFSS